MKTIVIGLGNPILGDDGVGWKVAEEVKTVIRRMNAGGCGLSFAGRVGADGAFDRL
jgi:Ni,Fe-hydrogenase maturation factor